MKTFLKIIVYIFSFIGMLFTGMVLSVRYIGKINEICFEDYEDGTPWWVEVERKFGKR